MKTSDFNKSKNELLAELLKERDNRPGEYSAILDPVTAAQFDFAMKTRGFNSLEELLLWLIPQFFEGSVIEYAMRKDKDLNSQRNAYDKTKITDILQEISDVMKRRFFDED